MAKTKRKPQTPVRSTRLVRLPAKIKAWLNIWKDLENQKKLALARLDFETAAANIRRRNTYAHHICQELSKLPNEKGQRCAGQ